jgi:hypothetical protein
MVGRKVQHERQRQLTGWRKRGTARVDGERDVERGRGEGVGDKG